MMVTESIARIYSDRIKIVYISTDQVHGYFIPYLSVIDLLFNEGNKSLEIIKNGSSQVDILGVSF